MITIITGHSLKGAYSKQYMINSILHTYWVQSDTSSCNGKSIVIRSVLASVIHIFYIVLFAVSD